MKRHSVQLNLKTMFSKISKQCKVLDPGIISGGEINSSSSACEHTHSSLHTISTEFNESTHTHTEQTNEPQLTSNEHTQVVSHPVSVDLTETNSNKAEWPTCWTVDQKNYFSATNPWLCFKNNSLGCSACSNVGSLGVDKTQGMSISTKWTNCEIRQSGNDHESQLLSLRRKISEHKKSSTHLLAIDILEIAKEETLGKVYLKINSLSKEVTMRVFNSAYYICKNNRPFSDLEKLVDLQILNGLNMGKILHSNVSCTSILEFISKKMTKKLVKHIVDSKMPIGIIIDESTTQSKVSSLIVYIRVQFGNNCDPVNLFMGLVELSCGRAESIKESLIIYLNSIGFTGDYLKRYLVAFCSDGCSTMVGDIKGVATLMKTDFPNIITWNCANHRLELSAGDVLKEVAGVQPFKKFFDKLYALYHASTKNSRELNECAKLLETEVLKIGRILDTRWVSSSFRSLYAVWQSYPALVDHLSVASDDNHRLPEERQKFKNLKARIVCPQFVSNLGVMCDALEELEGLSLSLQNRQMNMYSAHELISAQIQLFDNRIDNPGPYAEITNKALKAMCFQGVQLVHGGRHSMKSVNHSQFYGSLRNKLNERLMTDSDKDIINCVKVMYSVNWPADRKVNLTFGEKELRKLSTRFRLEERPILRSFRLYLRTDTVTESNIPPELLPTYKYVNVVPVSSSECERGFSQMNLICTPLRASMDVSILSSLLFIKLNGPTSKSFNSDTYVTTWLKEGRHGALDTNSRNRFQLPKQEDENEINMKCVWNVLNG